jgi:osmotically inducible protein OsmC
MIVRKSQAKWTGELKSGSGHIKLGSGAFEGKYSFGTRFEGAPGTNPEELLAAAHAGCFSMAFNLMLSKEGFNAEYVEATVEVAMDKVGEGMEVTGAKIITKAKVPGIDAEKFQAIARNAKQNCIISKTLSIPITLDATLA